MDAMRAFALMLGLFWHAAESFGPQNTYWVVVDCSPSEFLEWFRFGCHSFRMELFFVIAGFFARLMLVRRGEVNFIKNRIQRILVPLLIGWILLYPLVALVWLWGAAISGHWENLQIPLENQSLPIWKLCIDFVFSGQFLHKFGLIHLWFLHQLLFIYVLTIGIRWLAGRFRSSVKIMARLEDGFADVIAWRGAVICFSSWTVLILLLMDTWTVDTPNKSLIPYLPTTLLFGFCFTMGWFLHRRPIILNRLGQRWLQHLCVGIFFWMLFGIFWKIPFQQISNGTQIGIRLAYAIVYANMMWAFILGIIGLFTQLFQKPNAWIRYVADASYWIYLAHFPLVLALQVILSRIMLPWPFKYVFINVVTISLLILSYHYFVRGTFIGSLLNGRRHPVEWPWQKQSP